MFTFETIKDELFKMKFLALSGTKTYIREDLSTTVQFIDDNKICFTVLELGKKSDGSPVFVPKCCEFNYQDFDKLQTAINNTLTAQKQFNSVLKLSELNKDFE